MEVILLRGAEEDLWSAWEYYELIQPGLGDGFEAELQRILAQIARSDCVHPGDQISEELNVIRRQDFNEGIEPPKADGSDLIHHDVAELAVAGHSQAKRPRP